MFISTDWASDFKEACGEIRSDAILLESLLLRREEDFHSLIALTDDVFNQTFSLLLDYLAQHTEELYRLERKLEKTAESTQSSPSET